MSPCFLRRRPQFSVSEGCEGKPLSFTNQSKLNGVSNPQYRWAFGDGEVSQQVNPEHIYDLFGNKNPELVAFYDSLGTTCRDTARKLITVGQKVEASFNVDKSDNDTVLFIPANAAAETYLWDFGDGDTGQRTESKHTAISPSYSGEKRYFSSQSCGGLILKN